MEEQGKRKKRKSGMDAASKRKVLNKLREQAGGAYIESLKVSAKRVAKTDGHPMKNLASEWLNNKATKQVRAQHPKRTKQKGGSQVKIDKKPQGKK